MEAYTDFAGVYDLFMDETPYEKWTERIDRLLTEYDEKTVPEGDDRLSSEAALVVDLGCGTGTVTSLLKKKGYDMIGIDNSFEMLQIARAKCSDEDILFLNQDMRELELYSTVGAVICICDCVNYLLEEADLLTVFEAVNNYLFPRGLFIFDFNTVHKYRDIIGDTTIAENREQGSFIWENFYDDESCINEYDLTFYTKTDTGLYDRFEETHIQRGYELETILGLVKRAGLEIVTVLDDETEAAPDEESERIWIVAREVTK